MEEYRWHGLIWQRSKWEEEGERVVDLFFRRNGGHVAGVALLQAARRPHCGRDEHGGLFDLPRVALRRAHQRRPRDRRRLHQGLHVAVPLARHVRADDVRGQDLHAAAPLRGTRLEYFPRKKKNGEPSLEIPKSTYVEIEFLYVV